MEVEFVLFYLTALRHPFSLQILSLFCPYRLICEQFPLSRSKKKEEAGTKPPLKWKQPMKFWNEISWAVFHFFNKK
jgi:hypothetical protein